MKIDGKFPIGRLEISLDIPVLLQNTLPISDNWLICHGILKSKKKIGLLKKV